MSPLNQVNIEEKETTYDVDMSYHSNRTGNDHDVEIRGIQHTDGTVSVYPWSGGINWSKRDFTFIGSDPDRVIAIAQMMLAFAQMVKNENSKRVDTNASA